MEINAPEVVAELQAIYPLYEASLVTNDVDALVALFWDSPLATPFGITESLHGFAEIASSGRGGARQIWHEQFSDWTSLRLGRIAHRSIWSLRAG